MPLLAEIQTSLLSDQPISPILLKLRFLAARLGSATLEDWVKHESEGYPNDVDVPNYRQLPVTYTGHFLSPFRSVSNWTIPPLLVSQIAGENWLTHTERQSISGIEALIAASDRSGINPQIPNASNLVAVFTDQVLTGMHCTSVAGHISRTALSELQHILRNRILDLTIQLEAKIPGITLIEVSQGTTTANPKEYAAVTNNITNNIIHGNQANTNISDVSGSASVQVNVSQGDSASLKNALQEIGFTEEDAATLATIVASEKPDDLSQKMGKRATAWVAGNIAKVVEKVGIAAAAASITNAIASFYGLA